MRFVVHVSEGILSQASEGSDAATLRWHLRRAARALEPVVAAHEVVICCGNGAAVSTMALESENDDTLTRPFPLDALSAQSQGLIGYWMAEQLRSVGVIKPVYSLVTQVLVEQDRQPDGPRAFVGRPYTAEQVQMWAASLGWEFGLDRGAWRRSVPCYVPQSVVELAGVQALLGAGSCVVSGTGGGIPVRRDRDGLRSVEAVVDVAMSASRLAVDLHADRLVLLTDDIGAERPLDAAAVERCVSAGRYFTDLTGRGAAVGPLREVEALAVAKAGGGHG